MANYYPSDSSPSLLPRVSISTTPTTSPTITTRRLPPSNTASTPNSPVALGKVHPLEVQSGTKLRLYIEHIPPTSNQIAHISRAIDIANEILHGLFPTTFDPESYAEAFARCRSVSLVVVCVRTFFEVESAYAEKISKDREREESEAKLRESIAGEIGLRSVPEVTTEIAQLGSGAHVTVTHDDDPRYMSSYLSPTSSIEDVSESSGPLSFLNRRSSRTSIRRFRTPSPAR